jgi:(1->4)-alpha-D-glucan 1-alpha-D-glucosylmutase
MRLVTAALRLRRDRPDTFTGGGYRPLLADGAGARHLVAFQRGDDVVTAVTRHSIALVETGWGDTTLMLPDGVWTDRINGGRFSDRVSASDLFAKLPVALLERTDD